MRTAPAAAARATTRGNNDLLTLTRPDIIAGIHRAYLEAGADLVETNTFNSTSVSQADYRLEHLVRELNREGARLARLRCDAVEASDPSQPRFVIGVLGPTTPHRVAVSPDVNDPAFRNISFDELAETYREAARGLIDGGADIADGRDRVRHAQRQGRAVRDRRRVRGHSARACR